MRRYTALCAVLALALGAGSGYMTSRTSVAHAQACTLNTDCSPQDDTRTSAITVEHYDIVQVGQSEVRVPVEPEDGETWTVTAWYRKVTAGHACDCDLASFSATVDVAWNGTNWTATCSAGCTGTPFNGVGICTDASCSSAATHSWQYELIVDLDNNVFNLPCGINANNAALATVDYDTTSVDNGDTINAATCTEVAAVSPTSQVWSVTDTGAFECAFTCAAAAGPTVGIVYN